MNAKNPLNVVVFALLAFLASIAFTGCGGGGGGSGGGFGPGNAFSTDVAIVQSSTSGALNITVNRTNGQLDENISVTSYEVVKETASGPVTFTVSGSGVSALVRYLGSPDLDDATRVVVRTVSVSNLGNEARSEFSLAITRTPVLELTSTIQDHAQVQGALQLRVLRTDRAHSTGDSPEVRVLAESLRADGSVDRQLFDSVVGTGGITAAPALDGNEVRIRLTLSGPFPTPKVVEFDKVKGGRTDQVYLR